MFFNIYLIDFLRFLDYHGIISESMELKMKDLSNLILRLSLLFSLCFCSGVEGMQKVLKNPNNTMTRKI